MVIDLFVALSFVQPFSAIFRFLVLFFTGVLFQRFGLDSRRDFRGVVDLYTRGGSGDGTPRFATTDAYGNRAKRY